MKIAIFGDSYAADHISDTTVTTDYLSWPLILRNITGLDITNYAVGGSSMYYSWNQFQQHQHNYDRVIFMITTWDRMYLEFPDLPQFIQPFSHVTSVDRLAAWIREPTTQHSQKVMLQAAWDYMVKMGNEQQRRNLHKLMLKDIQQTRPDALLLSGFGTEQSYFDYPNQAEIFTGSRLDTLYYFEPLLGSDYWSTWRQTYECRRQCHLNRHNNRILAEHVTKWIKTHDINELTNIEWEVDPEKPWEYYFKKIK